MTPQHAVLAAHIGKVLKARRVELGVSQSRVAGQADITQDALWRIEQGNRIPRADTLLKLMAALGLEDQPMSFFARVKWQPASDGIPGMQLVIVPRENGDMREYDKAA